MSCVLFLFRVRFQAETEQRDSRHEIYENALTGRPCSANFGSHCGHRFDLSFGTPAGSISMTVGIGSRVSWVWVAGLVWVGFGWAAKAVPAKMVDRAMSVAVNMRKVFPSG